MITDDRHLQQIEDRLRRHTRATYALAGIVACLLFAQLTTRAPALAATQAAQARLLADSILRVRGLVVVDANGTDRVWIGAPLPDPPLFGKRVTRGGNYAGIILMDATGTERSGYATTDEGQVMITLDEQGRMVANFLAQPSGGVRLNINDEYNNAIRFGTSRDGPFLQFTQNGRPVLTLPDAAAR